MPQVNDELREAPTARLASSTPRSGWLDAGSHPQALRVLVHGRGLQLELDAGCHPQALRPGTWRWWLDPLSLSPLRGGPYWREAGVAQRRPQGHGLRQQQRPAGVLWPVVGLSPLSDGGQRFVDSSGLMTIASLHLGEELQIDTYNFGIRPQVHTSSCVDIGSQPWQLR
ncbi:unnamed protein product [Urochloa humidicola]